ncbi:hypothetical protein Ancab_016490 [Ancistrocladus abbreviatus]
MGEHRVFTLSQVAQHKSSKDCWLVIHGKVIDVTKFLEEHPGGEEVLLEVAGKDASKQFDDIGHSNAAQKLLLKYQVGVLQGYHQKAEEYTNGINDTYKEGPKGKEMSAFVIKESSGPKYAAFLEFFVPLVVAVSYFGYSYLARSTKLAS